MGWKGNSYYQNGKKISHFRSLLDADGHGVLVDPEKQIDWFDNLMSQPYTFERAHTLVHRDEVLEAAVERVGQLDFTALRWKLQVERGWTNETTDEVEDLYRKFLALNIRYPEEKFCPNGPVDAFWHAHILDTRKYAEDCEMLFGGFLHHFPYFGLRGDEAALEQAFGATIDRYIRHFGVDPTAGDANARSCRPQKCP